MKVAVIILSVFVLGLAGGTYYFYDSDQKAQNELETLCNTNEELALEACNLEKEKAAIVFYMRKPELRQSVYRLWVWQNTTRWQAMKPRQGAVRIAGLRLLCCRMFLINQVLRRNNC